MKYGKIRCDSIAELLNSWLGDHEVMAPTERDGVLRFARIESGAQAVLRPWVTKIAAKEHFLPQTECLYSYRVGAGIAADELEARETGRPRVLFGLRPCDARGIRLLDHVFLEDEIDPYYQQRRDGVALVGIACAEPFSVCFCTSVGGSPFGEDGLDLLLIEDGGVYYVKALSERGEALLANGIDPAEQGAEGRIAELRLQAEAKIASSVATEGLKEKLDANFDGLIWDRLHEKCLGCAACAFLCPTCHCFDLVDDVKGDAGRRVRTWDCCMFLLFTRHASGVNPRPSGKERVRQRLMHKFRYFIDNYGESACVGCGRCIQNCPVNSDVREAIRAIVRS